MRKIVEFLNEALSMLGLYQGQFLIELPVNSQK